MVKKSKGFTLVELLAVIVILAVILVIAVPSIMDTIKESRKGALASSAKLIASSAETAYISNQTLGIEKDIECSEVSNYTAEDYASCKIKFVDGKAKVTIVGKGKFEGMSVCSATKEDAEISSECITDAACFAYEETEAGISITGYSDTCPKDVIIPSKIDNKTVATIGYRAFDGNGLTSVTIPNSVTSIESLAFAWNGLTSVNFPNTPLTIGCKVFYNNPIDDTLEYPSNVTIVCNPPA